MDLTARIRDGIRVPATADRPPIASAQDYQTSRQVMLAASRNYSFASRFLPADVRPHVEALYAFLRVGDDRVDVSHDGFDSPLQAIDDWEERYRRAFARKTSDHPVLRAYLATALEFGIPESVMDTYFEAMRQDLTITRFATFSDLMGYIGGSALPVGRAMTYILGVRDGISFEAALRRADSLSTAMQLSNFWRDIGEDWERGRVYIPMQDMAEFGVTEADLAAQRVTPEIAKLLQFEIARTHAFYREAVDGVAMLARGRWAVMSGLMIYRAILTALEENEYDPFRERARANDARKLWLVARAGWHGWRSGTSAVQERLSESAKVDEELALS